jgi:hypothetical protein
MSGSGAETEPTRGDGALPCLIARSDRFEAQATRIGGPMLD